MTQQLCYFELFNYLEVQMKRLIDQIKLFIEKRKVNVTDEKTSVAHVAKEIFLIALIVHVILEILNKRSIIGGIGYIIANPAMFISGLFLLVTFYSVGVFIAKRHFWYVLVSVLWIGLGISNFIILFFRTTPLSAADFRLLDSVKEIASFYLSKFQILLITVSIILLVVGLVIMYLKFPKKKAMFIKGIILMTVSYGLFMGSYGIALETGLVKEDYDNIANAFKEYGFAYSFAVSVVKIGMEEPENYTLESIQALEKQMGEEVSYEGELPNIIFVQLESVFDINRIKTLAFNQNPMPNFTRLKKQFSSGYVTVPTYGAGTANTEFEILSGMNLKYFGPGEYPYKTILEDTPVESIAYNLSLEGMHTHAIHNNTGTFYSRNTVYPMLGFDSYSSIEYMNNIVYNPIGWSTDMVLIDEITKVINETEERDFVFAVSVQPHGKYPQENILEDPVVEFWKTPQMKSDSSQDYYYKNQVTINNHTEPLMNQFLYFANQLYEEDLFIGDLVKALEQSEEPVVLVLYGDHFPGLDISEEELTEGSLFQTDYVIWNNFGMPKQNRDLKSYELHAWVLEQLNYKKGKMNVFHQNMIEDPLYDEKMELLQYDMLYGDQIVYDYQMPFQMKEMSMGVYDTIITDVYIQGEALVVEGEHFTEWCEVFIDDEIVETIYLDTSTLIIPYFQLEQEDTINLKVSHVTESHKPLDETDIYTFTQE